MSSYHPEFVAHGTTGFLADSEADLEQKLALLIGDDNLRERMSAAATSHVSQFDWKRITLQWEDIFRAAVDRRRNR